MLASSSSDEELDDRQQPPPIAPTTSVAGCGGSGSVGRGHRGVGSRPAPGAHPTASGQTTRKPQSPLQQPQHCQPNGARCSQTRHQIFSSTSSRSSVRSNDTCDNAKHSVVAIVVVCYVFYTRHRSRVAAPSWYLLLQPMGEPTLLGFSEPFNFITFSGNDKMIGVACIVVF
ncbi:unnamed protein product [Taenia asiatica]|uniref:Uncharacterized protein n=1 Tax=Taenia asiatica TaxID=60517 RepID=A0A0R3VVN5_TAEAS|nr:unnamed protein product [Taenia asiatica]